MRYLVAWLLCTFFLLHNEITDDNEVVHSPKKYTMYLDQILSDGNEENFLSVYSLLNAVLAQILNKLPFIPSINL